MPARCFPPARLTVASLGTGLLLVALLLGLAGTAATPLAAAACPNESIRAEQGEAGIALPECRAYELVSPPTSSPVNENRARAASISGDRVTYASWNPFKGQETEGLYYVSERGPDGWSTVSPIRAQNGARTTTAFGCTPSFIVTPDLRNVILTDGYWDEEGDECIGGEPALDPTAPRGILSLYRTDPAGTSYRLIDRGPAHVKAENALLQAFNSDASVVAFVEDAPLTPDAPPPPDTEVNREENLYVWRDGTIRYVPYLPDGTPVLGHLANGSDRGARTNIANLTNAMSEDGERIFFEHQSKLYLRENALQPPSAISGGVCTEPAKACTIPIATSDEGPSELSVFGRQRFERGFLFATPDGSRVYFMDVRKLTPDSTAVLPVKNEFSEFVNGKPDLYEYNVGTGQLRDLTVNAAEPANVRGFAGASADGSYIYFVAYGNLTGAQENSNGDSAIPGRANLYLLHGGSLTYIATMRGGEQTGGPEAANWQEGYTTSPITSARGRLNGGLTSSVSANGKFIAFGSTASLTGFDNMPNEAHLCPPINFGATPGEGCMELFVYNADSNQLSCASCSPSGKPPARHVNTLQGPVPALWPQTGKTGQGPTYKSRVVTDSGAVFFETQDALLPADENTVEDVYEFKDGQLYLISTGAGVGPSQFVDASADGSSVFFTAGEGLVRRDVDGASSLYVARINGGFPEPPPLPGCELEACRGASSGPATGVGPGTASFSGPGNRKPRHLRDCDLFSERAAKLSKAAKRLRRQARNAGGQEAAELRREAALLAAKGAKQSKKAKTCRHANRKGGK